MTGREIGPSIKDVTTLEGGGGVGSRTLEDMRGRGEGDDPGDVTTFQEKN